MTPLRKTLAAKGSGSCEEEEFEAMLHFYSMASTGVKGFLLTAYGGRLLAAALAGDRLARHLSSGAGTGVSRRKMRARLAAAPHGSF
jgi:hypothetical protein